MSVSLELGFAFVFHGSNQFGRAPLQSTEGSQERYINFLQEPWYLLTFLCRAEAHQLLCDLYCTARIARRGKLREFCLLRHTQLMGNMLMDVSMLGELNPPSEMLWQFTDPTGEMRSVYRSFQDLSLRQNPICFYLENVLNKINCKKILQTRNQLSRCLCWFQSKLCLNWKVRFRSVSYSTPCTTKSISTNFPMWSQKHLGYLLSHASHVFLELKYNVELRFPNSIAKKQQQVVLTQQAAGTVGLAWMATVLVFFPQLIPLLQHFLILNIISLVAVGAESCSYVLR